MYQDVLVTEMQHHYYYYYYIYIYIYKYEIYIYLSYVFCEDVNSLTTLTASVTSYSQLPKFASGAEPRYHLPTAFIS